MESELRVYIVSEEHGVGKATFSIKVDQMGTKLTLRCEGSLRLKKHGDN